MGAAIERVRAPVVAAKDAAVNAAVNPGMARQRLDDGISTVKKGVDPGARIAERRARVAKALDARVGDVPGARPFEITDAHFEKAYMTKPRGHQLL